MLQLAVATHSDEAEYNEKRTPGLVPTPFSSRPNPGSTRDLMHLSFVLRQNELVLFVRGVALILNRSTLKRRDTYYGRRLGE